jgi:hypothetical protein
MTRILAAALIALVSAFTTVHAIPLNYELGSDSSVNAHNSGPGLLIRTALVPGLADQSFTINDGQSYTFNFFRIWTDEAYVDSDDIAPKLITATLDFDVPDLDARVHGITFGGKLDWQAGVVLWDDPVVITAGTRVFSINLNNAIFDWERFKLGNHPAMINATVKQLSSRVTVPPVTPTPVITPVNVPEAGSTLILLGLAVASMALLGRRGRA